MPRLASLLAVAAGLTGVLAQTPNQVQYWENDFADVNYTSGPATGEFQLKWANNFGGNFVIGKGYQPARDMSVIRNTNLCITDDCQERLLFRLILNQWCCLPGSLRMDDQPSR